MAKIEINRYGADNFGSFHKAEIFDIKALKGYTFDNDGLLQSIEIDDTLDAYTVYPILESGEYSESDSITADGDFYSGNGSLKVEKWDRALIDQMRKSLANKDVLIVLTNSEENKLCLGLLYPFQLSFSASTGRTIGSLNAADLLFQSSSVVCSNLCATMFEVTGGLELWTDENGVVYTDELNEEYVLKAF